MNEPDITAKEPEYMIREHAYEAIGRHGIAETYRYLAKFSKSETSFVSLNLMADRVEGKTDA